MNEVSILKLKREKVLEVLSNLAWRVVLASRNRTNFFPD